MHNKFTGERNPYYLPDISVLRNRLAIRDAPQLLQAEIGFSALRAAMIEFGSLNAGLPWLCAIHQQLFGDLYEWAGEFRKIDITRDDIIFCHFEYIEQEGNTLMQALENEHYLTHFDKTTFIKRLTYYYSEINVLHPFFRGSGRAQRIFFEQIAIHAGFYLDWQQTEAEPWRVANQQATLGNLKPLGKIFTDVVKDLR